MGGLSHDHVLPGEGDEAKGHDDSGDGDVHLGQLTLDDWGGADHDTLGQDGAVGLNNNIIKMNE